MSPGILGRQLHGEQRRLPESHVPGKIKIWIRVISMKSLLRFFFSLQNGGLCVDGINDYTCKCVGEYTGKFCDISPSVALMYPQTSPCQHHECKNGICYQPNGSTNDYLCKCAPGYSGAYSLLPRAFVFVDIDHYYSISFPFFDRQTVRVSDQSEFYSQLFVRRARAPADQTRSQRHCCVHNDARKRNSAVRRSFRTLGRRIVQRTY